MKYVVLGDGYLGSAFRDAGCACIGRDEFRYDGRNFHELESMLYYKYKHCDTIINCLGFTNTTTSEFPENFDKVWSINAAFVGCLSNLCKLYGKKLVHISTGDLYGNIFDLQTNVETSTKIDVGTTYRFTKYAGERFCKENDLILRIRLPFDGRIHPKNLLCKIPKFTKFYSFSNDYTYVPDLVNGTFALVENNQKGIFNVVSHEDGCPLFLLRNILNLPQFMGSEYDIHYNPESPSLINELSNFHIHNIANDDKFRAWYPQTPLADAVKKSWEELQNACKNPLV